MDLIKILNYKKMTTTLIVAGFISAAVFGGNIYFDRRDKSPVNWKRTLIWTAAAFATAVGIGIVTE